MCENCARRCGEDFSREGSRAATRKSILPKRAKSSLLRGRCAIFGIAVYRLPSFSHRRTYAIAALGIAGWLLLLSIVFWKERMLFADAPHILFRLLNDGILQIQEHRWGAFITQGTALLAGKLGLPLKTVMMLYSASFNLFYLAVIAILIRRHHRPDLALVFALYLLLLTTETFYWPNNEVHQGIGWMMLLFGEHSLSLARNRPVWIRIILFSTLAMLAVWTHPLVLLAAGFSWMFLLLQDRRKNAGNSTAERATLTLILLLICASKYFYAHRYGWYDGGKLEAMDKLSPASVPKAFRSAVATGFYQSMLREYVVFCAMFLAGLAASLHNRKYALAVLSMLYALTYFFLVAHTHIAFDRFYIESEWMPMTLAAAMPFVMFALPAIRPKVALVVLFTSLVMQSVWILQGARPFADRIDFTHGVLAEMRARNFSKALMPGPDEGIRIRLKLHWAAGVESMMLSALDGERPQRTAVFTPEGQQDSLVRVLGRDRFYNPWETRPATELAPRYFALDTTSVYQVYR